MICLQQNRNQDEPVGINEGQRRIYNVPLPKVELPTFHRDNPRGWLGNVENSSSYILQIASLYLEDKT